MAANNDWDLSDIHVYDGGRGVIGGARVKFVPPVSQQVEYGWGRKPDAPEWHSVRFRAGENMYKPRCSSPGWLHSPGDALLGIIPTQPFGPVCARCSALEELNRQTEAE